MMFVFLAVASAQLTLVSFDSNGYKWQEENDPVMGGESYGNFSVQNGTGLFQGEVKNVSFLYAPGFCQVLTTSLFKVDASNFTAMALTVRSSTPDYAGFKFAFNAVGAPRHHGGHEATGSYKQNFVATAEWSTVKLPMLNFSSDWSDYTGDCDTQDPDGYQHQCCDPVTAPEVCPDAARLSQITGYSFWAEGHEGKYNLEIKTVVATN